MSLPIGDIQFCLTSFWALNAKVQEAIYEIMKVEYAFMNSKPFYPQVQREEVLH